MHAYRNLTEFSRCSPETGNAASSQISQVQVGDQLKIVGDKNVDESVITAQRVYSGAFRTICATLSALGANEKSMTVKDLATKKDLSIALNADASIHKLPPMMAAFLARRLKPNASASRHDFGNDSRVKGEIREIWKWVRCRVSRRRSLQSLAHRHRGALAGIGNCLRR